MAATYPSLPLMHGEWEAHVGHVVADALSVQCTVQERRRAHYSPGCELMTEYEFSGREANDGRRMDEKKVQSMTDSDRIRVVVIFGGESAEHDVSCASAARIVSMLDRARYAVQPVRISTGGEWALGPEDLAAGAWDAAELTRLTPADQAGVAESLTRTLPVL